MPISIRYILLLFGTIYLFSLPACQDGIMQNDDEFDLSNYIHVPSKTNPTIQAAIDAAQAGDTIIVLPGTYKENLDMKGRDIVLSSLYMLSGDDSYIATTIVDGKGSSSVIKFNNGETAACVLSGFTLTNGTGIQHQYYLNHYCGGAIYCWRASPSLSHLIITENKAARGSGIYCFVSSPILEQVTFTKNTGSGCVIHNEGRCNIELSNVIIRENKDSGIGFNEVSCKPKISNLTIQNNSGFGIYVYYFTYKTPDLTNIVITDNSGLALNIFGSIGITNATIANNGAGIKAFHGSVRLTNSIVWNNTSYEIQLSQMMSGGTAIDISYSAIDGGHSSVEPSDSYNIFINYDTTNIESDPLFCDPLNGNYHLAENSPCVGTASDGGNMGALGVGCNIDYIPQ
jgi:hypothetical protein